MGPAARRGLRRILAPGGRRRRTAVEEGLLLAEYAARLEVRNRIEVATIGRDEAFDPREFRLAAAEALEALAAEQDAIARRLEAERRLVAGWRPRFGEASHVHDYRFGDRANLRLRAATARELADEIRAEAASPERLDALIERARQDAWRDVSQQLGRILETVSPPPDEEDDPGRGARLADLAAELDALAERPADPSSP